MKLKIFRIAFVIAAIFTFALTTSLQVFAASFTIIGGTFNNPWVDGNNYYDHRVADDSQPSPLPASGKMDYYAQNVMEATWMYRSIFEKYPICKECVGMAALMRDGDKQRKICIQRLGKDIEGPFYVIDVANDHDKKSLIERQNWIVDVGYQTKLFWKMYGPTNGTIMNCPANFSPLIIDDRTNSRSRVAVTLYNVNVRSAPEFGDNVNRVLPKFSTVSIFPDQVSGDWVKTVSGEWIYRSLLQ